MEKYAPLILLGKMVVVAILPIFTSGLSGEVPGHLLGTQCVERIGFWLRFSQQRQGAKQDGSIRQ